MEGGLVPHDDDATKAAAQDILTALASQAEGPVGHGPIRLGGEIVAREPASQKPAAAAPAPAPEPERAGSGPVGHGTIRLGGEVVARSAAPAAAAPAPMPEAATAPSEPVGHGTIRLGAPAVASGPDEALESARGAIFAALSGS
jgi:multifunctional 2-oxoglutarate metabolism enzyme